MKSTHYFNGKPYEVEDLGDGRARVSRDGVYYSVETTWSAIKEWQEGAYIQDAMPDLSLEEREFLISGFTPQQWADTFGEED